MALDVGRHMFVMWMSRGQSGIVRMREIVVPVQPIPPAINFVTVCGTLFSREIELFAQAKSNTTCEKDFPFGSAREGAIRPDDYGRLLNFRAVERFRDKAAVLWQRRQWRAAHAQ